MTTLPVGPLARVRRPGLVAALGLGLAAIGSAGPWITTLLGSVYGLDVDGRVTLGLVAFAAVVLGVSRARFAGSTVALIASALAAGTAGYDAINIGHALSAPELTAWTSTGWGIYATLAGSCLAVLALASGLPAAWKSGRARRAASRQETTADAGLRPRATGPASQEDIAPTRVETVFGRVLVVAGGIAIVASVVAVHIFGA